MNTDQIALTMQKAFPGVGFSISPQYEGETGYDKLTMADGHEKPTLETLIEKAEKLEII